MLEIKRYDYSVLVYDGVEKRGLAFPKSETTTVYDFINEVKRKSSKMDFGIVLALLSFDPAYVFNYRPMKQFLNGRDVSILQDDNNVKELYQFFFAHAILEVSTYGMDYVFLG